MYVFENVYVKEFVWIRKIIGVIDVWRRRCPAGNACYKNFKCVFLKSVFFKLVHVISQVLIDLKFGGNPQRMCLYRMNHGFQNLMFFCIFFTTQTMKYTRKIDILNSKCCHFFNFRNFAFSMVHAIAISILIEMHLDFWVSHNQVDWNHVNHSSPFPKTYFT